MTYPAWALLALVLAPPVTLLCFWLWAKTDWGVFAAIGLLPDVLTNLTWAALVWGWPGRGEWTVSKRLRRQRYELGRRGMWAHRLAEFLNGIKPGHI